MNKTLRALMTKIQWQRNELFQQQQALETQGQQIEELLSASQTRTEQACAQPARLLPEQEMARLNFMMNEQQEQARLYSQQQEIQAGQHSLTEKIRRLDTELNMLERYQEKQKEQARHSRVLAEQQRADEWTLLRGEPV